MLRLNAQTVDLTLGQVLWWQGTQPGNVGAPGATLQIYWHEGNAHARLLSWHVPPVSHIALDLRTICSPELKENLDEHQAPLAFGAFGRPRATNTSGPLNLTSVHIEQLSTYDEVKHQLRQAQRDRHSGVRWFQGGAGPENTHTSRDYQKLQCMVRAMDSAKRVMTAYQHLDLGWHKIFFLTSAFVKSTRGRREAGLVDGTITQMHPAWDSTQQDHSPNQPVNTLCMLVMPMKEKDVRKMRLQQDKSGGKEPAWEMPPGLTPLLHRSLSLLSQHFCWKCGGGNTNATLPECFTQTCGHHVHDSTTDSCPVDQDAQCGECNKPEPDTPLGLMGARYRNAVIVQRGAEFGSGSEEDKAESAHDQPPQQRLHPTITDASCTFFLPYCKTWLQATDAVDNWLEEQLTDNRLEGSPWRALWAAAHDPTALTNVLHFGIVHP